LGLNLLLDFCISQGKLARALDIFSQVRKLNADSKFAIKVDVITFNTMIKGCAQERKESLGFEIFKYMKECSKLNEDLRPNDVTYNSLIDACVRNDKMTKAWALLKEMQSDPHVKPDNFTYSTIIKGIKP
jgi:pentatricopeptide repeat protein